MACLRPTGIQARKANICISVSKRFASGEQSQPVTAGSENCVKAVETKLKEFGIASENHIVACVTDGASMMVKFGKIRSCECHLCPAHVIHLAVCDVLYKKRVNSGESTVEIENMSYEEEVENIDESEELIED
ncbi:hypothetical protein AVEN_225599-1 [Araneus ventricosus]|uniref:DUF659 domain-containing protein n=1 Tax=Araneus ventricosus TaxID=182803 RepID=A0A4Y2EXW7_ARAVE|nr:hypothetical protein AVEN_225599-1 [Araneus ventricosus]